MDPWEKTPEEISREASAKTAATMAQQTTLLVDILQKIHRAVSDNKTVEVENLIRQVVGEVSVERPDWINELIPNTLPLEKKLDLIARVIFEKEVVKEVSVKRPDWIKELIPKEQKALELKDFSGPVVAGLQDILKAINEKAITEKVEVTNPIEIKQPKWWSVPNFEKPLRDLREKLQNFLDKKVFSTVVENEIKAIIKNRVDVNVTNPQKVVSIDNIKEITQRLDLVSAQLKALGSTGSNSSGGSSGGSLPEGLATELKQDDIIAAIMALPLGLATETGQGDIVNAIENIVIPAPVGGATEAQQIQEEAVLNDMLQYLKSLAAAKGIASDIRVTLLGGTTAVTGTLTGVTTVAALTNMVNIGGMSAVQVVPAIQNEAAIQSNINNIIIS